MGRSIHSRQVRAIEKRFRKPLPELLRKLSWEDKLTQAEIAERLQVPTGTVGGWIIRFGLDRQTQAVQAAKEIAS